VCPWHAHAFWFRMVCVSEYDVYFRVDTLKPHYTGFGV